MRFVVTGEWTKNELLRVIVFFFLFYVLLFWVTNFLMYFGKMGLTYSSVVDYYLGSESRYIEPRSYHGLVEVSHFHLFSMGILMLTLTHLVLFVPLEVRTKIILILSSFSSAFLDEASSWLVRFVHPSFAYLKIASFITLQASILAIIVLVGHTLVFKRPSDYENGRNGKAGTSRVKR